MSKSVSVIMGSDSDWRVMKDAAAALQEFDVQFDVEVVSAHRTPAKMNEFAKTARARGVHVIIAGAGGAAHLPGMVASQTTVPVIGVPVALERLDGMDSLLSIVQMPKGIPVATVAINGAWNAGLLAIRILALGDDRLATQLEQYERGLETAVHEKNRVLRESLELETS
ncbi:5-(carboxyamino)imidazole ribonucleotide mutase [Humidisolicoccus flavus]|uniref:5-(carboxyamino)imidazole ribonucleotide mutase n=1 Tax=Humidisolicoccus flavus TaxID=3111414 RepID=UPI00325098B2